MKNVVDCAFARTCRIAIGLAGLFPLRLSFHDSQQSPGFLTASEGNHTHSSSIPASLPARIPSGRVCAAPEIRIEISCIRQMHRDCATMRNPIDQMCRRTPVPAIRYAVDQNANVEISSPCRASCPSSGSRQKQRRLAIDASRGRYWESGKA